jgi:hypothetical protein
MIKTMEKTNKKLIFSIFPAIFLFCFFGKFAFGNESMGLNVVSKFKGIEISWENESLSELESMIILKKENQCPEDIYDGQEVYRGNGSNFYDRDVRSNEKYCYALVVSDTLGNMSGILATKQIEKQSAFSYYIKTIEYNYIIIIGPVLIVVLWLIDRFTRRRDAERMKKKEAAKVIRF